MSGAMSAPDPDEVRPSLWRHADFMKLWTAETVSQLGSQVSLLALPLIAVTVLKATPFQVGLLGTMELRLQVLPPSVET